MIPRGCPSIASHTSIACSSSISRGRSSRARSVSRPSSLIDSNPEMSGNGLGALVTASITAEVSEQASRISLMPSTSRSLDCCASSRTRRVFFESILVTMASFEVGARPPSHILAIDDESESVWQVAHLTSHPSSIRELDTAVATLVFPIPGRPSSRKLDPSERPEEILLTISSLPCSFVVSGTGPTDLPLDFLVFFSPDLASSLPLSVAWNTFLRLGAPIT